MATEIGNIHIGLYVDVGESRRFTDVANVVERSSARMNSALGHTSTAVRALRRQMSQTMQFRIAQNSLRDLTRATDATTQLRSAIVGLSSLATGSLIGSFGVAGLIQMADKARLLNNQIATVTDSTANFTAVQESLFDVSQRTRSSYEATTVLYARMARATDHFNFSQEKLLRTTETIQKAFAIGGASPQEAQGAAIQLSQGIASDRFSGEEFRSVAENAPVLLRGIADALGVNIGKLREMAHAGELTAQVVTEAILKSSDDIDQAFAKMTPTVAQAWTVATNAILRYTGESDKAYGVTENIAAALMGLAENFEEVMFWVSRATAALVAFYAARKITMGTQNFVGGIRDNNALWRENTAKLADRGQGIANEIADVNKKIAAANQGVIDAEMAAMDKNAKALHAAKEKEYQAAQKLSELENKRVGVVASLGQARDQQAVKLRAEAELLRQRVRDDQLRVVQAQEAALAEERILRARQAQRLARADQVVTDAGTRVTATSSRVAETQELIAKERTLAKQKLANEIDARRQSLVTSSARLANVQREIAEMRTLRDLPDFDAAFGKQYNRLLQEQQKALIGSQKLRSEISSLEEDFRSIDAGSASTRGITAAMSKHTAAVREAEAAVKSLRVAEESRAKIAGESVTSKTLQQRVAAEAREIDRYKKSVDALQAKMQDLRGVTEGAFTGTAARRMIADIDALDGKILAAQRDLQTASAAVAASQNGNAQMLAASLAAQERAARQVNALQKEAANLLSVQHKTSLQLEASQRRMSVLRRGWDGFLGAFGGAWGLGITVALAGAAGLMAKFAADAQRSAQETENITKQLRDMGYLTEEAASAMDGFANSIAGREVSKLQVELENFVADLRKTVDELKDIDVGSFVEDMRFPEVGNLTNEQFAELERQFYATQEAGDKLQEELNRIREKMIEDKSMSDTLRRSLEDLALANPEISSIVLSFIKMGERMNALKKATDDWRKSITKIREEANKLPQEKFWNSRTEAAENQRKIAQAQGLVVTTLIDEANLNESEKRIRAIMDKIVKDMEKAGAVINTAAVRADAERIYTTEQTMGAVDGFVDRTIKAESGGKSNARPRNADGSLRSSAYGLGQFIEKTWLDLFRRYFPDEAANMSRSQILEMRSNTDKSRALIEAYAKENAAILQKAGLSVDEVALQLAHFLGPYGAVKVLKAEPGTPVSKVLGADAIRANPEVLGGGATVDDAIAYAQRRAGVKTPGTQRLESRENFSEALEQQQRALDALMAEAGIRSQLNPLVNDYDRALTRLEVAQKLLNEAQEQGVAVGIELKDVQQLLAGNFANLTPEAQKQAEAILRAADSYSQWTAEMKKTTEAQEKLKETSEEWTETSKDIFKGFLNDLRAGKSATEALGNALDKLADKLMDAGIDALFSQNGLGGLFNNFFGGIFGGGGSDPWAGLRLAGGGEVRGPGGPTDDKIPAMLSNGEHVTRAAMAKKYAPLLRAINEDRVSKLAAGGFARTMPTSTIPRDAGGFMAGMKVDVGVSFDKDGNLQAYVKKVARSEAENEVEVNNKKRAPGIAIRSIREYQKRG